ncbi:MAG: hypothetical protein Q7T28_13415 [Cypionkella sp.]|uniref:calcium-binding protein n=1 Tax=Cypionkella sp. TaxID=2811411 RepID=UPI00271F6058|nr:hypothetical protein [Cypionkella sp.]MDO8327919.1 hypothetical protein [Cypionkella sp.]
MIDIERIRGSNFADLLIGDGSDNRFRGLAGNDTLNGGAGSRDMVDYTRDARYGGLGAVTVDLAAGTATDGFGNTDTLISIEEARGSDFGDSLSGTALSNSLWGEGGNDRLDGRGGDDDLQGGAGNDTLLGGGGDDYLQAGAGTDSVDGGADWDTLSYRHDDTATVGVNVTFHSETSGAVLDWSGFQDTFVNIEQVRGTNFNDTMTGMLGHQELHGEGGDDRLYGNQDDDRLDGGDGNDLLIGGDGQDQLQGGAGNDTLDASADATGWGDFVRSGLGQNTIIGSAMLFSAGEGIDISYTDLSGVGGVRIIVDANGSGTTRSGTAGLVNDTFTYVHYFQLSQEADSIAGHNEAATSERFEGYVGYAGNDTLNGGTGGFDVLRYDNEYRDQEDWARYGDPGGGVPRAVLVNFATGIATDTYGNTDTFLNMESVDGTQLGDRFIGSGALPFLYYRGLGGADTIEGSAAGFDIISYDGDSDRGGMAGITADLTSGLVTDGFGALDVVSNIDAVRGTGVNDVIIGNAGINRLMGEGGNDRLLGEAGNDTLRGGDGADTLNGGTGDDVIYGGASSVDLRDIIYGGDGNDSIDAGYGNDLAFAGIGNDTVEGGFGADEINGQAGNDLLSGGALSDLIFGGDGFDFINGGFGADRLNGGLGADRFYHLGIRDHGSDWVQDYNATQGDVLVAGIAGATRAQFLVQFSTTPGAGQAGVQEAFITYRPTGQVLWALIDGAAQTQINLMLGAQTFDLLA